MAIKDVEVEQEILSKFKHFAVMEKKEKEDLLSYNPNAITHWVCYNRPELMPKSLEKKYDFVFFARITQIKGIEHLIEAVSKLKNDYSDISLLVLGPCSKGYQEYLLQLCNDKGVSNNVVFSGHIQNREDLFRKALEAKIYVLPTLIEGLVTSAVEAMLLGLPVITYTTGGMSFLNKDGENVLMAPTGDVEKLVSYVKRLLDDPVYAQELAIRGQNFAKRVFSEEANIETNIRQYRAIIANYKQGIPIPDELIFDGIYK